MVILKHVQALYYHLAKAVLYMNTAVVGVGLFVYGEYTQVSYTLYCICGVEVLPKVTFMPIDSFNVNIIGRVIGTVQGTLTPWFRLRLLHTMNVRFSLLDIAQRILGVTLPNFQ
jgi:hypothetical protein